MENNAKNITISQAEYEDLKTRCTELEQQVQFFMEQLRLSRHKQFGTASEKSEYDQISLFNEAEAEADKQKPDPELTTVEAHARRKTRESKDGLLSDNLPVEIVEYTLPEDEQVCPDCSNHLHVIGKNVRRIFKLIPAKAVIEEHVQYTYGCRHCEKDACGVPILRAKADPPLLRGSYASAEAVAQIMTQKFVMGVPLYRQEQEWNRGGVNLSRQTMSNWLLDTTEEYLEPIYKALHTRLCQRNVLHADETPLQVLHEPGKSPQSNSYMWLYRTSGDTKEPIVLYNYQPDRKMARPQTFLKDFHGYLHADGYSGYHGLPESITLVGCWAHARRKYDEALKSLPEKDQAGSMALRGKRYCDRLFTMEHQWEDCNTEERLINRQEKAKPVVDEFFLWLHQMQCSVKSAFGRAVQYCLRQKKYLLGYLLDGRLEISNNRAERSIKPFVIGRKNFLFANTPRGAKASAIMYSMIETAKENGLDPFAYLVWVFHTAPGTDIRENPAALERILPFHAPLFCSAVKGKSAV